MYAGGLGSVWALESQLDIHSPCRILMWVEVYRPVAWPLFPNGAQSGIWVGLDKCSHSVHGRLVHPYLGIFMQVCWVPRPCGIEESWATW